MTNVRRCGAVAARAIFAAPAWLQRLTAGIPVGRAGDPADVAALNAWLCSDEASYVVGAQLVVDGGMTAI